MKNKLFLIFSLFFSACSCGGANSSWNFTYPYEENGTQFFKHIAERTVLIQITALTNSSGGNRTVLGTGSGAIISSNGLVLTANHVVDVPNTELQIFRCELNEVSCAFICGQGMSGRVVKNSSFHDVATVRMRGARNLPYFKLGKSGAIRPGDLLWRVGMDPTGWAAGPLLQTLIPPYDSMEILMPAAPGASGGPLVNSSGKLVGTVVSTPSADGAFRVLTYAVPIDTARRVLLFRPSKNSN